MDDFDAFRIGAWEFLVAEGHIGPFHRYWTTCGKNGAVAIRCGCTEVIALELAT